MSRISDSFCASSVVCRSASSSTLSCCDFKSAYCLLSIVCFHRYKVRSKVTECETYHFTLMRCWVHFFNRFLKLILQSLNLSFECPDCLGALPPISLQRRSLLCDSLCFPGLLEHQRRSKNNDITTYDLLTILPKRLHLVLLLVVPCL